MGDYNPGNETIIEQIPDGEGGIEEVARIEYSDVSKMLLYMFYDG